MTREEIEKFLDDTNVYVDGKSEEIQKKLYHWDVRFLTKVVYRGNTELEITSVNGTPIDTVVIFKKIK